MTQSDLQTPATSAAPRSVLGTVLRDKRFLYVCALLLVLNTGIFLLSRARDRLPIPWPDAVQVDKGFVMTNFPDQLPESTVAPRYVLTSDARLGEHRRSEEESMPRLAEDVRLQLNVGEPADAPRLKDRASNWYMSRNFVDVESKTPAALRLWQLDLTYYTGEADTVAHVPGRCMVAAGGVPVGEDKVLTWDLPENALGWKTVKVLRSRFEMTKDGQTVNLVQYYTFCVNGVNEYSWATVRWDLRKALWQKYVYFGKIQFAPRGALTDNDDIEQADRAAQDFFTSFAVPALSKFPTADKVYLLNHPPKADKP